MSHINRIGWWRRTWSVVVFLALFAMCGVAVYFVPQPDQQSPDTVPTVLPYRSGDDPAHWPQQFCDVVPQPDLATS